MAIIIIIIIIINNNNNNNNNLFIYLKFEIYSRLLVSRWWSSDKSVSQQGIKALYNDVYSAHWRDLL
jgi:hypothetical protein